MGRPVGDAFATAYAVNKQLANAALSYWTASRLAEAGPWLSRAARAPVALQAGAVPAAMRVGALFSHSAGGDHFCTASVVSSRGRNMLITAAHCVHGGKGKSYRRDIVFVPGYRDGVAPHGIWTPLTMLVARGWARSSDPALDVAFIALRPLHGAHIENVLGANRLAINQGFHRLVRVTGYPADGAQAITCINGISRQSRYQMRFACKGYAPGTSGGPWVTRFDPVTRTGRVIGVIGGYERGGDTPDVSYSPYFDDNVERLYDAADR